jgi:hypothetical protein
MEGSCDKQSRTDKKGWSSNMGAGRTTSVRKKGTVLQNITHDRGQPPVNMAMSLRVHKRQEIS